MKNPKHYGEGCARRYTHAAKLQAVQRKRKGESPMKIASDLGCSLDRWCAEHGYLFGGASNLATSTAANNDGHESAGGM
jgi:hypothetical protein